MTTQIDWRLILGLALLAGGCTPHAGTADMPAFELKTLTSNAVPGTVFLKVRNQSKRPICLSIADFQMDSPFVRLSGVPAGEGSANRRPPVSINGFDVTSGLYVVVPGEGEDIVIDVSKWSPDIGPGATIHGKARAAYCDAIFGNAQPPTAVREFAATIAR